MLTQRGIYQLPFYNGEKCWRVGSRCNKKAFTAPTLDSSNSIHLHCDYVSKFISNAEPFNTILKGGGGRQEGEMRIQISVLGMKGPIPTSIDGKNEKDVCDCEDEKSKRRRGGWRRERGRRRRKWRRKSRIRRDEEIMGKKAKQHYFH